jgi:ATP-binding cassette subfamily B protein
LVQKLSSENSWLRLHRAAAFARPYRWSVVFILGLTLALAAIQAFEPLILKYIFDELGTERAMHSLMLGLIGLVP